MLSLRFWISCGECVAQVSSSVEPSQLQELNEEVQQLVEKLAKFQESVAKLGL
jgi:hypothetical protein